ncbi:MAG: SRPBCC family protein [Nitrospirae bacterium]|nr:SRPBCC family protein [Nitrospirota bacterium]
MSKDLGRRALEGTNGHGPVLWVHEDGAGPYVTGAIEVGVGSDTVWDLIRSYERHPEFIRVILAEEIRKQTGRKTLVRMKCGLSILAVKLGIDMEVEMREEPSRRIEFSLVRGNTSRFEGYWAVHPLDHNKSCLLTHAMGADVTALGWFVGKLIERLPGADGGVLSAIVTVILKDVKRAAESQRPSVR